MAGNRLTRVAALERQTGNYIPGAWIEAGDGETVQEAMARHERETGALNPDALHIVWVPVQPRAIT